MRPEYETQYDIRTLHAAGCFRICTALCQRQQGNQSGYIEEAACPYVTDMEKKDAAWVRKQYHLDSAAYEQALVYGAASAMEVNEIAVFKQADKTKREALQKLCQERTDRQLKSFQGYAPRQSALLEKAAVYEDGRYVVVLIHPQQSRLRQLLKKAW